MRRAGFRQGLESADWRSACGRATFFQRERSVSYKKGQTFTGLPAVNVAQLDAELQRSEFDFSAGGQGPKHFVGHAVRLDGRDELSPFSGVRAARLGCELPNLRFQFGVDSIGLSRKGTQHYAVCTVKGDAGGFDEFEFRGHYVIFFLQPALRLAEYRITFDGLMIPQSGIKSNNYFHLFLRLKTSTKSTFSPVTGHQGILAFLNDGSRLDR